LYSKSERVAWHQTRDQSFGDKKWRPLTGSEEMAA
jgi:hypothetical protein